MLWLWLSLNLVGVQPSPSFEAHVTRLECVGPDAVELEVTSAEEFPVRNALTELQLGSVVTTFSRYPDGGDLHTLIFTLTHDQLASITSDDQAVVQYAPSNLHDTWLVGPIDTATAQNCE